LIDQILVSLLNVFIWFTVQRHGCCLLLISGIELHDSGLKEKGRPQRGAQMLLDGGFAFF